MIDTLLEKDLLPDSVIRWGIRRLLKDRIRQETKSTEEEQEKHLQSVIEMLKQSPIAIHTAEANEQHYELPPSFFEKVLGPHLKYSSGFWDNAHELATAERAMLELTCKRAEIANGQSILELGCGWGSLTLYMAKNFPNNPIVGVSNSRPQKEFIERRASQMGLSNVTIVTADMNDFSTSKKFDRVVSVEMFEHMRNYELLLEKIHGFLKPDGKLFVHIFAHKKLAYTFEDRDASDWMSRYFFTGGIMPSDHLLYHFDRHFQMDRHWTVNGTHYEKTANAWLANMDRNRTAIMPLFVATYAEENARKWWVYWRVFFMACAELWGFRNGTEWFVSHYLLVPRTGAGDVSR